MKILLLSRYGSLGASSRYRSYQYLPYLRSRGLEITVAPLLGNEYLRRLYNGESLDIRDIVSSYGRRIVRLRRRARHQLIWIEYEALPWLPSIVESLVVGTDIPYVVDYDDAVFHRYDLHRSIVVRALLKRKIDSVMRKARVVIAGNRYLADRAFSAGASRIEIIPSVVDLDCYPLSPKEDRSGFTIGWIGSPSTQHYLTGIQLALDDICRDPLTRVVAIGARSTPGLPAAVTVRPWSAAEELHELQQFDVGIMPLIDSEWERGKCGHKLIKYMACALPVVASPVGVNGEIVSNGRNGILAGTSEEWSAALMTLKQDSSLRNTMGLEGRRIVEEKYCTAVTGPRLFGVLTEAAS
ncbi:MAG: glycosyltransferase family 4 protein [Bacteroidota bacterium]